MLSRLYSPSRRNREDGFTLIELLIVVIIIGILAAIALPIFLNQQKAANDASVQSDVRNTVDNVATWQTASSNQSTAEANTNAFIAAGGKAVISNGDTVGVTTGTDGSYTVCGYVTNGNGNQFKSNTAAFTYTTATGAFGSGSCVSGSDTGGASSGSNAYGATAYTSGFTASNTDGWTGSSVSTYADASSTTGYAVRANGNTCYDASNGCFVSLTSPAITVTVGRTYTMTYAVQLSAQFNTQYGNSMTGTSTNSTTPTIGNYASTGTWISQTTTFTASASTVKLTMSYHYPAGYSATLGMHNMSVSGN